MQVVDLELMLQNKTQCMKPELRLKNMPWQKQQKQELLLCAC
jgi:hypothetical protein